MKPPPRLLLITRPGPEGIAPAMAALAAADTRVAVQLRDKTASARELAERARVLLPAIRERGAALIVNDRVDVARAVGADGVHLPEAGLTVADARNALGPGWIGRSCHDPAGLAAAARAGASYATLSPIGAVPGKNPPLGIDGFAPAAGLPVLALGGVEAAWVGPLLARGAHGVAVRRAIYDAPTPADALADLLRTLPQ